MMKKNTRTMVGASFGLFQVNILNNNNQYLYLFSFDLLKVKKVANIDGLQEYAPGKDLNGPIVTIMRLQRLDLYVNTTIFYGESSNYPSDYFCGSKYVTVFD